MNLKEKVIREPTLNKQRCPLCHVIHPMIIEGIADSLSGEKKKLPDRGYSFCNCRNIFFTDWSNIDTNIYNEFYADKYQLLEAKRLNANYNTYFQKMTNIKSFGEIGCINDGLLDEANKLGWSVWGSDINPNWKGKYKHFVGDLNNLKFIESLPKTDCVWASHIFEHFKEPLKVAKTLKKIISNDGYLFVAMPDPWFINHHNPHQWGHWHIREHHIMWDMDSFIDALLELGYKLIFSKRNPFISEGFICYGDYHILFQK